jgi:hypothetical protein
MERLPIPNASEADRETIGSLAKTCNELGQSRYDLHEAVRHRLITTFAGSADGSVVGTLNNKARDWWQPSLRELGEALKTSFKLKASPFANPRIADEWEPYLNDKKTQVARSASALSDSERELNERVYLLFNLSLEGIKLLEREVEH